jgi:hypothetical protein
MRIAFQAGGGYKPFLLSRGLATCSGSVRNWTTHDTHTPMELVNFPICLFYFQVPNQVFKPTISGNIVQFNFILEMFFHIVVYSTLHPTFDGFPKPTF